MRDEFEMIPIGASNRYSTNLEVGYVFQRLEQTPGVDKHQTDPGRRVVRASQS